MSPAASAVGVAWEHPDRLAWALLLVPLFLLARRLSAPEPVATGALRLWQSLAARAGAASRRRARLPLSVALLLAALGAGLLALAEPVRVEAREPERWTLVLDLSPRARLAWTPPEEPPAAAEGPARYEKALERAEAWLSERAGGADRLVFVALGREPWTGAVGERPPADWLAERAGDRAPDWAAWDRAGAIWIAVDALEARAAGLSASGGGPVPGLIGSGPEGSLAWDGERVRPAPPTEGGRGVARVARGSHHPLPDPIDRALRAWAEARRRPLVEDPEGAALVVVGAPLGSPLGSEELLGRDGWSALARSAPCEPFPPERASEAELWLAGARGSERIAHVSGRVHLGLVELAEPAGDPSAFAISFARLFDQAALPPPGVRSLDARLSAGAATWRAPQAPPEGAAAARGGAPWLAALAAVLALAASTAWLRGH